MNAQPTPNPKCSQCSCYWQPDDTDIKSSGLHYKTCKKCRERDTTYQLKRQETRNEKIDCECGGCYIRKHQATHLKTKIHTEHITSKAI